MRRPVATVVRGGARDVWNTGRLVFAAKTAVAAVIAWALAPYVPLADDQYSYYAPLGVLVSMYPTIAASVRTGVMALVGLGVGLLLGLGGIAAVVLGAPGIVVLAVVIGVGVLFGGIRALGAGRDWIAIAALFVLLASGAGTAGEFSLSYLVNMAFGVLVGVTVNVLIVPPLFVTEAAERLSSVRDLLAARLRSLADAVAAGFPSDSPPLDLVRDVSEAMTGVRADVAEARESSRGNPRGRRRRDAQDENDRRLRALEDAAFVTRDLADVLGRMAHRDDPSLTGDLGERFAGAIRACADLIAEDPGAVDARRRLDEASAALDGYLQALDEVAAQSPSAAADELTAAVCLRRLIEVAQPFV